MRICFRCKRELPDELFCKDRRRKDGLSNKCKECQSFYSKEHYKKRPWRYKEISKARKEKVVSFVREFKSERGCYACGYNRHPEALDLHHLDPSSKEYSISTLISNRVCEDVIIKELEKCIVLCSNCHRELHAGHIALIV